MKGKRYIIRSNKIDMSNDKPYGSMRAAMTGAMCLEKHYKGTGIHFMVKVENAGQK